MLTPVPPSNLILRRDAAHRGLSGADLRRHTSSGALTRVRRGGYLDGPTARELDETALHAERIRAGLSVQHDASVVSHVSAAVLHGLPVWSVDLDVIHLTKMRRNSGRRGRFAHVHTTPLGEGETTERDGVTLTSTTRTILDLACSLPFEQAVVFADAALHHELTSRESLVDLMDRSGRRHGLSRARLVIAFADGRSESVGESRSRVGMHRARLPTPGLQRLILRPDASEAGRTDFDWGNLLGEFDGPVKYGRLRREGETPGEALTREKLREDGFRDLGFGVVRWIWSELNDPARLYQRIRVRIERERRR